MPYRIDKGFIEAVEGSDVKKVKEYLNKFSENKLKYQDVEVEFEYLDSEGCRIHIVNNPIHETLWACLHMSGFSFRNNGTKEINDVGTELLNYIIDTYGGEPQELDILQEIVKDCCRQDGMDDIFNTIVDNGFIAESMHKELMELAMEFCYAGIGDKEILDSLLNITSKHINEYCSDGVSYLGSVVSNGNIEYTKLFLDNGAKLNVPVFNPETDVPALENGEKMKYPIDIAKFRKKDDMVKFLEGFQRKQDKEKAMKEVAKDIEHENSIHVKKIERIKAKNIKKIKGFN